MNKYLITYDLKNVPLSGYTPLHEAIKKAGIAWWHYLESTWIVKSNATSSNEISNSLIQHFQSPGDRLLVVKIDNSDFQGFLPAEAWNWLNS